MHNTAHIEAVNAARRGWRVLPVYEVQSNGVCSCGDSACKRPGKHPRITDWPTIATTSAQQIESWAKRWPGTNWGLATGTLSGVVVVDVDPRHQGDETLYAECRQHGQLPPTPQCVTGGGGRHLYFKHPGNGRLIKNSAGELGPGLDIRGDGGFVVLPGSTHATGQQYRWDDQHHPDSIPLAATPEWLIIISSSSSSSERETEQQSNRATEDNRETDSISVAPPLCRSVLSVLSVSQEQIDRVIAETLPSTEGQRNRRLFDFARRLKAIPELSSASLPSLRPIVALWHEKALPVIGTKPLEETWGDFAVAWDKIKQPHGTGPLELALRNAKAVELPEGAMGMYDDPKTILLLKLCRELQRAAGPAPFFLSCDTAGRIIGLDRVIAWRRLKALHADGWIEPVEKPIANKATRYRYIGRKSIGIKD